MKIRAAARVRRRPRRPAAGVGAVVAHHEILAKFDDKKPVTLTGVVTLRRLEGPARSRVHERQGRKNQTLNWAIELESPIDLAANGWSGETVQPGDTITVEGCSARNGSRQAWAEFGRQSRRRAARC